MGSDIDIFAPSDIPLGPGAPEPVGGSEEALVEVSNRLAARGYRVRVWTNRSGYGDLGWKGVTWLDAGTFEADRNAALLLWRFLPAIRPNARRVIGWPHDGRYEAAAFSSCDVVLTLSDFHEQCLRRTAPAGTVFHRAGNGLPDLPPPGGWRPHSVVYASSPERGLDGLLYMWPDVLKQVPDATLDITYGWDNLERLCKSPESRSWSVSLRAHIDTMIAALPSITWHGRLSRHDADAIMARSSVFAYPLAPGSDSEMFCIALAKAQAFGLYPVVTTAGALPETLLSGRLATSVVRRHLAGFGASGFADELIVALLEEPDEDWRVSLAQRARSTYSWDKVVDRIEAVL